MHLFAFFLCFAVGYSHVVRSIGATGEDWMKLLPDRKMLSDLSIPGTHDSGSRYNFLWIPGTANCQNLTIPQQLRAGVRFLDIRCYHLRNRFLIYHGCVYQHLRFEDVLDSCFKFLDANNGECIIMSVRQEGVIPGNTRTFDETFQSYVDRCPKKWILDDKIPTIGEARGKIVLLRRFEAARSQGIDATYWPDNRTFTNTIGRCEIRIQDHYRICSPHRKLRELKDLYSDTITTDVDVLFINFTSGYKPSWFFHAPRINAISDVVNPELVSYLKNPLFRRRGITVMDFADEEMCSLLFSTNLQ